LYAILIGPVANRLQPGESLVLVPDGLLNRLPFALLKGGGSHLVENHALFYAPSLQSLYYIRKRQALRSSVDPDNSQTVIALGCSGISSGRDNQRVYPYTSIEIEPLPGAAAEARAVAGMFPNSEYLIGNSADERSIFEEDLGRAQIVHIAAHSYVDNKDVRRSFIVLNPPPADSPTDPGRVEDGLLQWHEITSLKLNARLVTLSACRAAGGVLAYGEGITGLSQAFLYAGAGCVLASFIDVPDLYAGRFMSAFYRHIDDGFTAAAALKAAQNEAMIWTDTPGGPALWGSFALVGDGNIVIPVR
jgi:CHAT domain-containing protein